MEAKGQTSSRGHWRSTVILGKDRGYLSGEGNFDGYWHQLRQEAAVKGDHEHDRVVVGENKCNLQATDTTVEFLVRRRERSSVVET